MEPRGRVGRIYKEDNYILLHRKHESSWPCGFGEDFFICFSQCKLMGANDPRGGAYMDPTGMVGRIYKEYHYTLLHTNYESSWTCGFGEEDFNIFPMTPLGQACMSPMGTLGRIYKEDHYTLLHTKYESSVPCGFEEDSFMLFPL